MRRRSIVAGAVVVVVVALAVWWSWPGAGGDGAEDRADARARSPRGAPGGPGLGPPPRDGEDGDDGSAAVAGPAVVGDEPTDEELAARAKELEASPQTHVICDLGLPIRSGSAYLAIGDPEERNGRIVEVVNGKAYLPLVYDLGELGDEVFDEREGVFSLDGHGPQPIAWTDPPEDGRKGRCTAKIEPKEGDASLTGTLTHAGTGAPAAGAWIEGCGNLAFADGNGIVHMDIQTSPCSVVAMRQDGALRTTSGVVSVVPIPGGDVVVDLTLPEAPKAGLGVRVSEVDGGVLVDGVIEGGPGQAAGLEAGDVVVGVDGEPTTDMSLAEFVSLAAGPSGSSVVLSVERGGQALQVTVVRGPVPG